MNNIEILEMQLKKIKNFCKDNNHYYPEELPYYIFWDGKQAEIVENLIQENKELKEKLQQYKKIEEIVNTITDDEIRNAIKNAEKDYILKSKVKEKIEELKKEEKQELKGLKGQDRYFIKQIYQAKRIVLEKLLEEGE